MATKTLSVVITGDASKAQAAFKTLEKDADSTEGRLARMGEKISPGLAVAAAAVVAGVGLMLKSAFQAADESARIGRESERVIKTTGASAWTSADQVADYAEELAALTGVDDEVIQSGANLLLTFTRVQNKVGEGNDVFDRATQAALDVSTALGTDMNGAAIQVGKALQDPIRGVTQLGRAGIVFSDEQKAMIRTLVETGDVLGAQKIILGELETQFGGAAEAAGTPLDKLKVQIGNLQEDLGSALIPVVAAAADALGGLVTGFSNLPAPLQVVAGGVAALAVGLPASIAAVAKLADITSDSLGPALRLGREMLDNAALGAANLGTKMGLSQDKALTLASGISGIGSIAGPAMAGLGAAFVGFSIIQDINSKKAAEQKQRAEEFTAAIESQTGVLADNVNAVIAQQFANEGVGQIISNTTADVKLFGDSIVTASDRIKVLSDEADTGRLENFEAELRKGAESGDALSTEMLRLKESGELSTTQLMELANQLDDTSNAYNDGRNAAELNKGMTDAMATASQNAANQALANADAIRDASNASREAVDPFFAASQATKRLEEAQVDAFLASLNYTEGSPEMVAANEAVAQAAMGTESSYLALAEQMERNGSTTDEMKAAFQRWVDQGWITQGAADQITGKFEGLGGSARAYGDRSYVPYVGANTADAERKLSALHQKMIDIYNITGSAGQRSIGGAGTPGFAAGGRPEDGWSMVGEEGPELMYKSGSSVEIFSNEKTSKMIGGGGGNTYAPTYNVVVNGAVSGEDVVEALVRYEKRNGAGWRN